MGQGYTKTVDWWTLGVLLYEMLTGLPPFYNENTNEMYRKILAEPLHFPGPEIVPPAAKDLLIKLLDRDPEQRLGARGAAEIKAHPFFHSIDWRKLLQRKYEPTFKPNVVRLFFFFFLALYRPVDVDLTPSPGRCPRYGQLRSRVHLGSAHGLVRRRTDALSDDAAAVRRLVLQSARGGTWRCWWQRQGPVFWQCRPVET